MRMMVSILCALLVLVPAPAVGSLRDDVRRYRQANEKRIVGDFVELLSQPNVAANRDDIARNVEYVRSALAKRGLATRILSMLPAGVPKEHLRGR